MNLIELPWLPPAPASLRSEIKSLRGAGHDDLAGLRRLATSSLNVTQLTMLDRALPQPSDRPDLPWLKLAILSNATVDLLPPALRVSAIRHDLWMQVQTAEFGSYMQDALDPDSATNTNGNDFILMALDHRALALHSCIDRPEQAPVVVQAACETIASLAANVHQSSGATVIMQTLPTPADSLFGSLDSQVQGSLKYLIDEINNALRKNRPKGSLLFDVAHLAAQVGLANWHDPASWFAGKFAFSHDVVPLYADHLCRILMAARGKSRKCLVLDLDNTLWGGVIGDDGMGGIVIGQGSATGEAFLAVQAAALALRERGVVLAVSSKNDEAVARRVFAEHPDMLLREDHIAVFQANWQDKASNLLAIAETLNIGVDALVFLDDNPAERAQVRLSLPMVAVPELPDHPDVFATLLMAAGYFESVQFTAEDRERAGQYQANAARRAVLGDASNLDEYLRSLDMVAEIAPFDEIGRARIAQLINKTNQFNLTTRRHSEADVAQMESDSATLGLQLRLRDRFGDNGMIAVVICETTGREWVIDTWLMSCRVLNRKMEAATLDTLAMLARARGATHLIGVYRPSERNGMVSEHYRRLGFELLDESGGETRWRLDLATYEAFMPAIDVRLAPTLLLS